MSGIILPEAIAVCRGPYRSGIDPQVILLLQRIDELIRDMRVGIQYPTEIEDEDGAVRRYLVYLSVLVDVGLSALVMSAIHGNDVSIIYQQRLLVEYAAKAAYFNNHPDYALYMTTIQEAESVLQKSTIGGADKATLRELEKQATSQKEKFSSVAAVRRVNFDEIMREVSSNREYAWLYGAPSALMHGDPEGMRYLFDLLGRDTLTVPDNELNAMLVDAAGNSLMFCDQFVSRFHTDNKNFSSRISAMDREIKLLWVKHPQGRDEDAIVNLKAELESNARRESEPAK